MWKLNDSCQWIQHMFLNFRDLDFTVILSVYWQEVPQMMSCGQSKMPKRARRPTCTLCQNHGIKSDLKGHKYHCNFSYCCCELCEKGREKREVMRKQVKLRRHQMREIDPQRSSSKISTSPQRGQPSAVRLEPRHQVPSCNVSPGYPYPRLPPQVMSYPQSSPESLAYYMNTCIYQPPSPGVPTPPSNASPVHRGSPIISGRLSVSDNSAFVKFLPQTNNFHGMVSDRWHCYGGVTDSKEAAYTLAALQHKNSSRMKNEH